MTYKRSVICVEFLLFFMKHFLNTIQLWFDSETISLGKPKNLHMLCLRCFPFIVTHLACFSVFQVGCSYIALFVCFISYLIRMFAITGFYHRYFSHRGFETSRFIQFIFSILAMSAAQRGPLWWAAHHRHHHKHSDKIADHHSPKQHGFLWSHLGWFFNADNFKTDKKHIQDLLRFPELIFLNRYDFLTPCLYAIIIFCLGVYLERLGFDTNGSQLLIWGYFISTVILYHATFSINSLGHIYGTRRFPTKDNSRNNWWLAILTLGEGWHNNHHFYPSSARQGFFIHEIDITYYFLKILERLGLIWNLRLPPTELTHEK